MTSREPAAEIPHEYRIVVKDVTWTEAYEEAGNVPGGYLVNINSLDEWNTIQQLIEAEGKQEYIFWLGAMRSGNSQDYYWVNKDGYFVDGSINGNSNWLSGEPSFYDEEVDMEERYVDMFYRSSENRWVWNDTPDDIISLVSYYSGKVAYIVEIENE